MLCRKNKFSNQSYQPILFNFYPIFPTKITRFFINIIFDKIITVLIPNISNFIKTNLDHILFKFISKIIKRDLIFK